jgi:hypothetical protein
MTRLRALAAILAILVSCAGSTGCAVGHLVGGMMQNAEYQKQIEVPAKYPDLEGKSVAVVVDADRSVLYEFPQVIEKITTGVTLRIGRDVPSVRVMRPDQVVNWQWRTPQWNAMSYGGIAQSLGVERVILIDLYEYRLNPPGNQWLWECTCAATVNVIEADGFDPDMFADSFTVATKFPSVDAVDRSGASAQQIETGLLAEFVKQVAWLFHLHIEPKYPDKFRPEAQPKP